MTYSFDPFLQHLAQHWYDNDPLLQHLLTHFAAPAARDAEPALRD